MEAGQTAPQGDQHVSDELIFNLLQAALSRPADERESFLHQAADGNQQVFDEVHRRLEWETRLNGFLLTPVVARERIDRPFVAGELVLERFRIVRVAGEGGMGVVYEAVDERLDQRWALKCPHFEFRKRISQEARKALAIAHPNVCRVFGFHTAATPTGEVDFLAMEFLDGETLASRLGRPIPERWLETPEGKGIALQICAGLKAVHDQGITHRDLKPGNIMLTPGAEDKPRAVIMDFGIAQAVEIFSSQKQGTPAYVAPEIWEGHAATTQSDLYALGVILYQMATGRLPFPEGTDWKTRLTSLPPPPTASNALRAVILRCLTPKPDRDVTLAEVEQALEPKSRRWLLGLAGGAAASMAAGVVFKDKLWPTRSAVRLAVLPRSLDSRSGLEITALAKGLVNGVAYRLKSLPAAERPFFVFSHAHVSDAATEDAKQANEALGATHVLDSHLVFTPKSGWRLIAELIDAGTLQPLEKWDANIPDADSGPALLELEERILRGTVKRLALGAIPPPQPLPPKAYASYRMGQYYVRDDYEEPKKAIPYFEEVIKAAPQSALGYCGLAETHLNLGQSHIGDAMKATSKAHVLDPDLPQVHYVKARIAVSIGYYEVALEDLRRAAQLNPRDAEIYMEMMYAHYLLHELDGVETAFQKAIEAEPGYYKPYIDYGNSYFLQANYRIAEQQWLKAHALAPRNMETILNLAQLYLARGWLEAAKARIIECLNIGEDYMRLAHLGAYQERTGSLDQAIHSYRESVRLFPTTYVVYAQLGNAYRRRRDAVNAAAAFQKGLERAELGRARSPREADRVAWTALYYANLNDAGQARERAERAWEMADPTQADVRGMLIHAYDRLGDRDEAAKLLKSAPPDLLAELGRSLDLSDGLKQQSLQLIPH